MGCVAGSNRRRARFSCATSGILAPPLSSAAKIIYPPIVGQSYANELASGSLENNSVHNNNELHIRPTEQYTETPTMVRNSDQHCKHHWLGLATQCRRYPQQSLGSKLLFMLIHGKCNRTSARIVASSSDNIAPHHQRQIIEDKVTDAANQSIENKHNSMKKSQLKRQPDLLEDGERRRAATADHRVSWPLVEQNRSEDVAKKQDNNNEVILFTSVQQLCYEIFNQKLLETTTNNSDKLCVFIFGRPGSNKGELAYELVDHSSISDFIDDCCHQQQLQQQRVFIKANCPLYHYIDVSALILANIEQRIHEYNKLAAQALRMRSTERAIETRGTSDEKDALKQDAIESNYEEETSDAEEDLQQCAWHLKANNSSSCQREPSILSELSEGSRSIGGESATSAIKAASGPSRHSPADQFGLPALSTQQRSILQMQLFRYKSCVTMKWIRDLIEREIFLLEQTVRVANSTRATNESGTPPPRRIYLINLVPNQLNLFKPCLFLQQEFEFAQFKQPYWGLKFERQTNIRLMVKERAVNDASKPGSQFKLPGHHLIKFPTLLLSSSSSSSSSSLARPRSPKGGEKKKSDGGYDQESSDGADAVTAAAASLLTNGINEKLGPKYNENFAQQFHAAGKLLQIRYNPIKNYNYADYVDCFVASDSDEFENGNQNGSRLVQLRRKPLTCSQQLVRATLGELRAQSPSSISSVSLASSKSIDLVVSATGCDGVTRQIRGSMNNLMSHEGQEPFESPKRFSKQSIKMSSSQVLTLKTELNDNMNRIVNCDSHTKSMQNLHVSSPMVHSPSSAASTNSRPSFASSESLISSARGDTPLFNYPLVGNKLAVQQPHRLVFNDSACLVPKWAVELELITSKSVRKPMQVSTSNGANQNRWPSASSMNKTAASKLNSANKVETSTSKEHILNVFHPPASRSSSRSPLMFQGEKGRHVGAYFLVQTKVAYENGKNQRVLEVKRFHHRVLRYKSHSDLANLLKLITKARLNLARDLSTWLAASIVSYLTEQQQADAQQMADSISVHQEIQSRAHNRRYCFNARDNQLSKVAYTLRVDISRMVKEQQEAGTRGQPLADVLVVEANPRNRARRSGNMLQNQQLNNAPETQRPASSIGPVQELYLKVPEAGQERPASCNATTIARRSDYNSAKKHVRFCLCQAPDKGNQLELEQVRTMELGQQKLPQRRTWIDESLFASCRQPSAFRTMDSIVKTLKSSLTIDSAHHA